MPKKKKPLKSENSTENPTENSTENEPSAKPFIKWAGGKTKLLAEILKRAPESIETYYEPFLGGGAVFFALASRKAFKKAVLCDTNEELINTFRVVQSENVHEVISILRTYPHSQLFFENLRKTLVRSPIARAARFIYLNKTCYNGLYRVNRQGVFNVPFGNYKTVTVCPEPTLLRAHEVLQGVELRCEDFRTVLKEPKAGDWVYMDPPYLPLTATSNFTSYTSKGFGASDHADLAQLLGELQERGVKALLSNSNTVTARKLFLPFKVETAMAPRAINSVASKRMAIEELLFSTIVESHGLQGSRGEAQVGEENLCSA